MAKKQGKAINKFKKNLGPKQYKRFQEIVQYLKQERVEDQLMGVLPENDGIEIRNSIRSLNSTELMADPVAHSQEIGILQDRLKNCITKMPADDRRKAFNIVSGGNSVGYDPAGSILRRLYPNTFGVYAFLGDNYWAAVRARREVRVEVLNDGIYFKTLDGTSRKKVRMVWQSLNELGLLDLREDMVDHLNLYGNCWLRPVKSLLGGIQKFELLQPERISPQWDRQNEYIVGWEYQIGGKREFYAKGELIHLKTYSSRTMELGSPTLSAVVTDMEASIFASIFNQTVFQKGGMIGNIVSLKGMDPGSLINDKNFSLLADAIQARFEKKYAGVKGAGQILISPFVDKVFKMMSIGEMDGSFKTMTEATDRKVAQLLCCSPDKIGIPFKSQYEAKDQVNDRIGESFDNNVNYLCSIVDDFINDFIVTLFGFSDVKILSGKAYKSQAVAAAQYLKLISEVGPLMTIDEGRELLKREPFGGDLGRRLLDNSAARVGNKPTTSSSSSSGADGAANTSTTTGGEIPPAELGPPLPNYGFGLEKRKWVVFSVEDIQEFDKYNKWSKAA